jgi:hypothetical protein
MIRILSRDSEDEEAIYELVGECYIETIMQGEIKV